MFWYLIFCATGYKAPVVCNAPLSMPDKETCEFVGKSMIRAVDQPYSQPSARCVGVRKPLSQKASS